MSNTLFNRLSGPSFGTALLASALLASGCVHKPTPTTPSEGSPENCSSTARYGASGCAKDVDMCLDLVREQLSVAKSHPSQDDCDTARASMHVFVCGGGLGAANDAQKKTYEDYKAAYATYCAKYTK